MSELGRDDMRRAVRVLARLARILDHTDTGLSLPQYRVLAMISRGDQRSSRLAARLAVKKPTVTAIVDGLVAARHLRREVDPADRRASALRLTPLGRRALARADAALVERLEPLFSGVSAPDRLLELFAEIDGLLDAGRQRPAVVAR